MTIPATARRAGAYEGNDSATSFAFSFKVFADTDIAVVHADAGGVVTELTKDSDYSVTLNSNQDTSPGGSITYPITGDPLPDGETLTITGNLPYDQPLDLPTGGNFSALAAENEYDRLAMQIQQLKEQTDRSLHVPVASGVDTELPMPVGSTVIGWGADAEALVTIPIDEMATAVAYGQMLAEIFAGDGSETDFELTESPVLVSNAHASIDGVTQANGTDFVLLSDGVTIRFDAAPPNGSVICIRYGRAVTSGVDDSAIVGFSPGYTAAVSRSVQAKLRDYAVSVKDFGATGDGVTDDQSAIQATIDAVSALGGGTVYLPPGNYVLGTVVSLKPLTNLIGAGVGATRLVQKGATCVRIGTTTYLKGVEVSGFTLDYQAAVPVQTGVGLRVRSCEGCWFHHLRFENYDTATSGTPANDGQTAISINPENTTAGEKNTIMNCFSDLWIDAARIGVYYSGLTASGAFDVDIYASTAVAGNVITGNVWYNITMRSITYRGIQAVQWADAEKWTSVYIRIMEDDAICINLGSDATNFTQIDRFRLKDVNVECDATTESTCSALRIGPGGIKHEILGLVTDGVWDSGAGNNFFDVSAAQSFHINSESDGQGANYQSGDYWRGSSTMRCGAVTFGAADTTKTITVDSTTHNKLHRAPTAGEIMLTPRTDWGSTTKYWISAVGATSFDITVNPAPGADFQINWQIRLLDV